MIDNLLDKIGIGATTLCAIHCILLPVLLPALPVLGLEILADDTVERGYLLATVMLGFIAIYTGFKKYHRKLSPFYLLSLGAIIYWYKHDLADAYQNIAVILGAICIILAHLINIKLCKSCQSCDENGACA